MNYRRVGPGGLFGIVFVLALGCDPGNGGSGGSEDGGTAGSGDTGSAPACNPGQTNACACTDGANGTQSCNADGSGYGACMCGGDDSAMSASASGADSESSDDGSSQSDSGSTSAAESGDGDSSTGQAGCAADEIASCDGLDGPGYAECNPETGEFGDCLPCMGSHPLVEGDLRYCEEGLCYCGNLMVEPPVDACYGAAIADACCAYDVDCY